MFIIAANKTVTEQRAWSGYFLFYIFQDLFVVPLAFMTIQYILIKLTKVHSLQMRPSANYRIYSQLNRNLEELFVNVSVLFIKVTIGREIREAREGESSTFRSSIPINSFYE